MPDYAAPLEKLIQEFKKMPGIGAKSAQRLAFTLPAKLGHLAPEVVPPGRRTFVPVSYRRLQPIQPPDL